MSVHCNLGRDLNLEIERDGRARSARTASHVSAEKPRYSTPGKNLRAAEAAAAELPGLSPLLTAQSKIK